MVPGGAWAWSRVEKGAGESWVLVLASDGSQSEFLHSFNWSSFRPAMYIVLYYVLMGVCVMCQL